jgi:hypothetical protein
MHAMQRRDWSLRAGTALHGPIFAKAFDEKKQ